MLTFVAFACLASLFIRMKAVCGLFEGLLRRMGQHAMVSAYRQVPQRLKSKVAGHIFSAAPQPGDLDAAVRCLNRLEKSRKQTSHAESEIIEVDELVQLSDSSFHSTLSARITEIHAPDRIDVHAVRRDFAELLRKERQHKTSAIWTRLP